MLLPGGRNASGFPRQAAACSVLLLESHHSSPLCVRDRERVCPCVSVYVCVNVSERCIIVDVSVCAHSRFGSFPEERGSPLRWTAKVRGKD